MAANFNQTNKNQGRYFFATVEEGEQDLYTTTAASGAFTDFYVGITGSGGNQVQINQMVDVIGTSTTGGEEMLYAGTASTYKTLSTLSATATGISLSTDRTPGSGIATIESYRSNGSTGGYEFLSRGTTSELLSTPMDSYLVGIGRAGATAVLGATGDFIAGRDITGRSMNALAIPDAGGGTACLTVNDLSGASSTARWNLYKFGAGSDLALASYNDAGTFIANAIDFSRATAKVVNINQYAYPQAVISVAPSAISPGAITVNNATPTTILTIPGATGIIPGSNYYTDINIYITCTNPNAFPVWLQLGVQLGGTGATFNYENPWYVPPGGIPVQVATTLNQITDAGTSTNNILIVAYQQGVPGGAITVTASTSSSFPPHLLKQIT